MIRALLILLLLCSTSVAQTVTPSSVVQGRGGLVTITGNWSATDVFYMDGSVLPRVSTVAGVSTTVRVKNRTFWHGPKRIVAQSPTTGLLIDNQSANGNGFTITGAGWTYFQATDSSNLVYDNYYDHDRTSALAGSGTNVLTWSFTGLTPGGYTVYTRWHHLGSPAVRATDAPYTIKDGATPLATVDKDQQVLPDDRYAFGLGWESLGQYTISGTTLNVELSDSANNFVSADAVWIIPDGQTGMNETVIDGKLEVTKYRPFGTELPMFDFEDNPPLNGGTHYKGDSLSHQWNSDPGGTILHEPSHGSAFSWFTNMPYDASRFRAHAFAWITNPLGGSYVESDGTVFSGNGAYIPEAVGCNRYVYDIKLPAGFWRECNTGTYHILENDGVMPDAEGVGNLHYYEFWHTYGNAGGWYKIYDPLQMTAQRGSNGSGVFGLGMMRPLQIPSPGEYAGFPVIRWSAGMPIANSPLDVLTRHYVNPNDGSTPPEPEFKDAPVYFDNVGFASVDEKIRTSAEWIFREGSPSSVVSFPFSVTNSHQTLARDFYVFGGFTDTLAGGAQNNGGFLNPHVAGEDIYRDVNINGAYDAGTDTLVNSVIAGSYLLGAIPAGETQHFIALGHCPDATGQYRQIYVALVENITSGSYLFGFRPTGATELENATKIARAVQGTAYVGLNFIAYVPATLPADTVTVPTNPAAMHMGSDTWVNWDAAPGTASGTTSYYKVERSDNGTTGWTHHAVCPAPSPGYIDYGVQGKFYRVSEVNVRGTQSSPSDVAGGESPAGGMITRTRRGIRFGLR